MLAEDSSTLLAPPTFPLLVLPPSEGILGTIPGGGGLVWGQFASLWGQSDRPLSHFMSSESPVTLCPAETRSGTPLNQDEGSNPVAATVAGPEQLRDS